MSPWLDDGDVAIHVGDVRAVLAELPDESVDSVITSPPYWGLRDYGTGSWAGGDPDCDHTAIRRNHGEDEKQASSAGTSRDRIVGEDCRGCGARRVDQQLGLEPTPDLYVQNMVAVFREVRRVLAPLGTCWLNLGDSYASGGGAGNQGEGGQMATRSVVKARASRPRGGLQGGTATVDVSLGGVTGAGLKPKDLVGIPWRVAFALQADGWWLRSEIIWAKPNPMPESVTDRPTKSHEYVFLLSKQPRYWFDQEAVREPHRWQDAENLATNAQARQGARLAERRAAGDASVVRTQPQLGREKGRGKNGNHESEFSASAAGRNVRSVWNIATQPFAEAHFATFPEELVRRCLLAGCPAEVCSVCGKPRERIVERENFRSTSRSNPRPEFGRSGRLSCGPSDEVSRVIDDVRVQTVGWSDCGHHAYRSGVVLDPFLGSGTTALVARHHGRHAVGVELNQAYAEIAARRLQQLSLGVVA